ncbi:MAG: tRNA nucleotidyltransferase [Ruthenibacterium sp.]
MQNSWKLPPDVTLLLRRLQAAGFAAQVVGGCVRDVLRGACPHDWDICTAATPDEVTAALTDTRLVPTGLRHGTVTAVLHGKPYEITTYRTDGAYTDHRRPDSVAFTRSLENDLARRDFTINAMAYSPADGLVDPFGGQRDLAAGVLRCVGAPALRFAEDALRILRALRFASVLGFALDSATSAAIHAQKDLLRHVSVERIYTELTRLLCGAQADTVLYAYSDVLAVALPDIAPCINFARHSALYEKEVWLHTLAALKIAAPDPVVRWALLLHDLEPPLAFPIETDGTTHFRTCCDACALSAGRVLFALHCDGATLKSVIQLVRRRSIRFEPTAEAAADWLNLLGENDLRRLLEVQRCDALTHLPPPAPELLKKNAAFSRFLDEAFAQHLCLSVQQLAVNGNDIISVGIPQGAAVGAVLRALLHQVVAGMLPNEPAALLAYARTFAKAR